MTGSVSTYFDRIFIINLARRIDRWAACERQLALHKISNWERVPGFPHPTNGHAGCTRSHRELLRCVSVGGWERVLVLEDDFHVIGLSDLLAGGFQLDSDVVRAHRMLSGTRLDERFAQVIDQVPQNWDVLYLGGGYAAPPIARVNAHVVRNAGMLGTASYGITRAFARRWTAYVDERFPTLEQHPGPIDSVFCAQAQDAYYYTLQPRLITQRASFSDITEKDENYLFSMTDPAHEAMV